jgi:hypothetical protein
MPGAAELDPYLPFFALWAATVVVILPPAFSFS